MKILLACSSGMSTSILVKKIKEAADIQGTQLEVWAVGQAMVEEEMKKADVLLFGPQMRFLKAKYEPVGKELNIPVDVINPIIYGRCDGQAVLKQAMDLIEANK